MTGSIRLIFESCVFAVLAAAPALPAQAQQSVARAVVQPLPPPAAEDLREALRALARDSTDLDALVAAGDASLALDDTDAATGFFSRAQAVSPQDRRVKAGFAVLAVRRGDAVSALQQFGEAAAAGDPLVRHARDLGLAYDLVGNNPRAQQFYQQALGQGADDRVTMRLALSQAIAGNQRASEATLLPLLQRQDLAAYRVRAFALAALGKTEEAVSLAEALLPEQLSSRMAPYLRYMPRLTRAQQAAAANLGVFPPASEAGRDDPRMAPYTNQAQPSPSAARQADSRLAPDGEPPGQTRESPALAAALNAPVAARAAGGAVQAPETLTEIFADFRRQSEANVSPAAGAVDITSIKPPREAPATTEPRRPAHPSRHWVQVATGRDTGALGFDWRRIRRNADGLLDDRNPFIAVWGQRNRLLSGPYANEAEAQHAVTELKARGVDSFTFTSAEGEAVSQLD